MRIRKNDIVSVITGKDKGKRGKVLKIFPQKGRTIVEGINFVKRHIRKRREDEPGGIIQRESPMHISNLMLYCNKCNRSVRTGVNFLEDGSKIRVCRRCGESI